MLSFDISFVTFVFFDIFDARLRVKYRRTRPFKFLSTRRKWEKCFPTYSRTWHFHACTKKKKKEKKTAREKTKIKKRENKYLLKRPKKEREHCFLIFPFFNFRLFSICLFFADSMRTIKRIFRIVLTFGPSFLLPPLVGLGKKKKTLFRLPGHED